MKDDYKIWEVGDNIYNAFFPISKISKKIRLKFELTKFLTTKV